MTGALPAELRQAEAHRLDSNQRHPVPIEVSHIYASYLELLTGFEPATSSLRKRRSGRTELKQQIELA